MFKSFAMLTLILVFALPALAETPAGTTCKRAIKATESQLHPQRERDLKEAMADYQKQFQGAQLNSALATLDHVCAAALAEGDQAFSITQLSGVIDGFKLYGNSKSSKALKNFTDTLDIYTAMVSGKLVFYRDLEEFHKTNKKPIYGADNETLGKAFAELIRSYHSGTSPDKYMSEADVDALVEQIQSHGCLGHLHENEGEVARRVSSEIDPLKDCMMHFGPTLMGVP